MDGFSATASAAACAKRSVTDRRVAAALRAYTVGGAFASFEEEAKGTLEVGMLADLQVYDRDPLLLHRDEWDGLRPRAVLQGGTRVFGEL